MDQNKMYVILSLDSGANWQQEEATLKAILDTKVHHVKRCIQIKNAGALLGITLNAYMCEVTKKANMAAFIEVADLYHQETMLVISSCFREQCRIATVHHVDTNTNEHVGFYTNVGRNRPENDYIFDTQTKEYYICKKDTFKLLSIRLT